MVNKVTCGLAMVGAFLLASPAANAWTEANKAECTSLAKEEGEVCVPLGPPEGRYGGCSCSFTSLKHAKASIERGHERARKADEEWARRGGKPDPSSGDKPKGRGEYPWWKSWF